VLYKDIYKHSRHVYKVEMHLKFFFKMILDSFKVYLNKSYLDLSDHPLLDHLCYIVLHTS